MFRVSVVFLGLSAASAAEIVEESNPISISASSGDPYINFGNPYEASSDADSAAKAIAAAIHPPKTSEKKFLGSRRRISSPAPVVKAATSPKTAECKSPTTEAKKAGCQKKWQRCGALMAIPAVIAAGAASSGPLMRSTCNAAPVLCDGPQNLKSMVQREMRHFLDRPAIEMTPNDDGYCQESLRCCPDDTYWMTSLWGFSPECVPCSESQQLALGDVVNPSTDDLPLVDEGELVVTTDHAVTPFSATPFNAIALPKLNETSVMEVDEEDGRKTVRETLYQGSHPVSVSTTVTETYQGSHPVSVSTTVTETGDKGKGQTKSSQISGNVSNASGSQQGSFSQSRWEYRNGGNKSNLM